MGRINQTQPTLYRVSGTDEGRPTRHRCPAGYPMLFNVDLPYTGSERPAKRATLQKYHYRVTRTAALSPGASSTALRRRRPPNHRVPTGTPRLLTTHRNLPTLHLPGTWERPPGATLLIDPATLFWRRFGWTGLVGGIPFPAKFTRALLLPPCQTALPCTGTQRYIRRRATRPPRKPPETSYPVRTLPRPTASSKPAQPRDHVRPAYPAAHRRRRRIDISLRAALYGRFVMGNRGEERLTLSGSWQQGHSTAYRTVSHS